MDTSTLLWFTGIILSICATVVVMKRRHDARELRFDDELDSTNSWIMKIAEAKDERPITPPPSPGNPRVVRIAPEYRVDETVVFRHPAPQFWSSSRPSVHRFTPQPQPQPEPETHHFVQYHEPEPVPVPDTVYRLLPDTESFSVIPVFTSNMQADTDLEIEHRRLAMERFMRQLLGEDEYAYASAAVDRAGGPKAILGGSWTP